MKEYLEIEIFAPESVSMERLRQFSQLTLDVREEKSLGAFSGKPLASETDPILRLNTQIYADYRLSFDYGKAGTLVSIFSDFKKTEILAEGVIKQKYFQPAKKEDWKISEELGEDNAETIPLDLVLSNREQELLALGDTPLEMENKWFVYADEAQIHFLRSWTGIEIFIGYWKPLDEDHWQIYQCKVGQNPHQDTAQKKAAFENQIRFQLSRINRLMS